MLYKHIFIYLFILRKYIKFLEYISNTKYISQFWNKYPLYIGSYIDWCL